MTRGQHAADATVAALIGSDLRGFDRFAARLDALFASPAPEYDAFISTDAKSLSCAHRHGLLPRPSVRWAAESPDTAEAIRRAFGPLPAGVSPHHLHQWWRLQHAWLAMERHERHRDRQYEAVVRLRSDLRLPGPLKLPRPPLPPRELVMRGDWVFWGARDAVRTALEYVDALPHYHAHNQRAYEPLPYRHIASVGAAGLNAGLHGWLKFPKQSASRAYGFPPPCVGNGDCVVRHSRQHLDALEGLNAAAAVGRTRLRPDELTSIRDGWWRWDGIPDNEKYFLLHVLNRSLTPKSFLDVQNRDAPAEQRISFLGRANGLLMPERHHPNCTCVCRV